MNKQKSTNDHNNCDTINAASYVSISDNNISQNRIQSNNPHHQHRLLVLQNQSASSSQKGSLDKKADNAHQNYNENTVLSFQQYSHGLSQKSPKKMVESDYLNSQENPINSQDEIYYFSKNINGTKNGNQNRHKTPYQRIYVEQQSIQKQSVQNNQNSLGIQSSSQNVQNGNNYRFSSQNKKEQTPKNKIFIEEGNTQYKSNNRSAIRDLSNEGYYNNSEDQKMNRIYGDLNGKQNNIAVREQLHNILQQQNSSIIKKLNGNRHNSQVNAYPNQDSTNQNQTFNIRQIKKKSSISMNESQLTSGGGGGSGKIIANNGQTSQVIVQNIKDRDGSGGKVTNQQNSMCKYDSIRNMHNNSQENSQQNIQSNNNKNNSSIYQYQPESQIFQVNIYNNQERQERIQQVYLGNKLNLTKKQMSPQKEVNSIQYETIDVNNKRKAKSTQRQQSILRERKQNSNTINFVHLNQSGGSANSGFGSNNNLSLYSLNQNQQNNVCMNSNHNNLSYESCYSSQNANKFYFRSKNVQTGSGAQSNQIQNSIAGCLPSACQQNSSQIAQTTNQAPPSRRQLPQIKDTYNTIDNSATNPSSSLYKAKNVIRINGSVADKTYTNRTLDAQPLSSTSKQDKSNKIVITTINNDKKCGTLNDKSNPIINTNTNKTINRKSQLNDTQLFKQIQQLNHLDSLNENTQNKINSRSQSIRRGRFQNIHNQQSTITQNKVNSQKENFPAHYQQQQAILTNNLQLQSCKHRDESSKTRQKFTSKNEQSKMIIINQQENNQFNLQDIVDAPVVQKQENIKIQQIEEQRCKGYNTISIEEQKRCVSQTENRPESQVQKEKQNFYKQSYAIEKIQHLRSIETGDLIPTTNKINFERNGANPIHSPILNRDSSPVPQVHTPTKKRIKNQNQLNQKIEFFPQPPPPPPMLSSQNQQQNYSKVKYGQIIQKYQRGNIVKPKIQNAKTNYANQSSQQNQQLQQDNQQGNINPNSAGFVNKRTSQVSTNIALSSNHCEDIQELKFNRNYVNDESKNIFLNDEAAIDQTAESMDNLVKSLQDEVYQEIKDQEKEPANQHMHLHSLENSFYDYFTSNHQNSKSQNNLKSNQTNQQNGLEQIKLEMEKQYSNEPEKPTVNLQKDSYNKITEKNEDQVSSKAEGVRKDDFIFSTLDAFNRERKGSKAAKIIIDFDMDDDNDAVLNNNKNPNKIILNNDGLKESDKQQHFDNPKIEEQDFKINLQNSHKNLIEEPIDSGRNSPQVSKISTAVKPLYYKYNNSFHQIQQTPDDTDINDIENNQPTFEKFIKSKVSNMRNSILKQSVRYENNFFNQQKLFQQQQQSLLQQQQQNQLEQQQQQLQSQLQL
ncbi:hypothetical protein ABPG72_004674 [Tetrahymena utriculariae]